MKSQTLVLFVLVTAFTSLSACGAWWLPRAHKIDVQQGNLLSIEKIKQIKVGMTKNEVARILGQPVAANPLDELSLIHI